MSIEDPVQTVIHLLRSKLHVMRDSGVAAEILVSEANLDRELLLRQFDAQVAVSLDNVQEERLTLDGGLRRLQSTVRCSVFAIDKPGVAGADAGRVMRWKVVDGVCSVVRENRFLPFRFVLDFNGVTAASGPHKAYACGFKPSEQNVDLAPGAAGWVELDDSESGYRGLWRLDDEDRVAYSVSGEGEHPVVLFGFKIGCKPYIVKKFVFRLFCRASGNDENYGFSVAVWNNAAGAWNDTGMFSPEPENYGPAQGDFSLDVNCGDFVDGDGFVWVLVMGLSPSDGETPAWLYCWFLDLQVDVNGLSFIDVVAYRPVDLVDVKPFVFKEDVILRGWCFERVPVTGVT